MVMKYSTLSGETRGERTRGGRQEAEGGNRENRKKKVEKRRESQMGERVEIWDVLSYSDFTT